MFVGPTTSHVAHYRQSILGGRASMLARLRLANTQFGVLAASPMEREHDVTHLIVDVHDDVGDQRAQHLLAGTHRHVGCVPGR
ncbi:hypothetical protein [Sphingomonas sanxanigenens]|uniref:Uncharacterized protein n=1 Tax=Sphingomonas sanxanigenens DSM 19645 = NX02 TaxID=1123269 RepID=W0AIZ6_9SPHN|nr:hypothetical protein [Sphingomonas sanxanigenens]AHE55630.1 hypothetical protein NX02_19855 [Sphingomonas sanxanigenens DSM 19645 = NX02]